MKSNMSSDSKEELKPHVGMTVWVFDENRRIYPERKPGEAYGGGGPIWREHWTKRQIVGETSKSWLVGYSVNSARKHLKKDFPSEFGILLSEDDVIKATWIHDNAVRLADSVRRCRDYSTLQQIAAIIGYKEEHTP